MMIISKIGLTFLLAIMLGIGSSLDINIKAQDQNLEENDNVKLVKKFYLSNDPSKLDQYLGDQFVAHMYSKSIDKQSYIEEMKNYLNAFPNATGKIHQIISDGDIVAILSSWNGTQKNELHGLEPSGKQVEFYLADFFRVADDKIVEAWGIVDIIKGKIGNSTYEFD